MEEITQPRGAVEAATLAEAFRITAADRADDVAIRTRGDAYTIDLGGLRDRVDALAGGLAGLGVKRGDTVALMLANRPEFHLCDLAAMTLGADTVLDLQHLHARADPATCSRTPAPGWSICEEQFPDVLLEAREELPAAEHVIVVDGEAPRACSRSPRWTRCPNPGFDVEAAVAGGRPRRRAHADLHLGHDRPAEGRGAVAPQPPRRDRRSRRSSTCRRTGA